MPTPSDTTTSSADVLEASHDLHSLARISEIARQALKNLIAVQRPALPPHYERAFFKTALEMGEEELVNQLIASLPAGKAVTAMVEGVSATLGTFNQELRHYRQNLNTYDSQVGSTHHAVRELVSAEVWTQLEQNFNDLTSANQQMQKRLAETEMRLAAQEKQVATLQRKSRSDGLTGALNRLAMEEDLTDEFARNRRYQGPFCLLMADIDFFKKVNDTHGHAMGDEVLKVFCAVMVKMLRDVDRVYRYGGEEFVILLPETPLAGGEVVAERLCRQVAAQVLKHRDDPALQIKITASFGLAAIGVEDNGYGDVLKRADQALYRAKQGGRNRVEVASP